MYLDSILLWPLSDPNTSLVVFGCESEPAPQSHLEDSQQLNADGVVELFEFHLTDGSFLYLKNDNEVTWQGNTYEKFALHIEGVANNTDDESARPKLTAVNPEGVFSALVASGVLDNAIFVRRRVLLDHINQNANISRNQSWRIRRVIGLNRERITFELRDRADSQFFLVPGRMFIPPEFPQVSLS